MDQACDLVPIFQNDRENELDKLASKLFPAQSSDIQTGASENESDLRRKEEIDLCTSSVSEGASSGSSA